jgi:hypothetical protein
VRRFGALQFDVTQERRKQRLRMPEGCHAATTPVPLAIVSTQCRGGALTRVQPGLQLAQELLDTTGQPNQLLIIAGAAKGFHALAQYTSRPYLDVWQRTRLMVGIADPLHCDRTGAACGVKHVGPTVLARR